MFRYQINTSSVRGSGDPKGESLELLRLANFSIQMFSDFLRGWFAMIVRGILSLHLITFTSTQPQLQSLLSHD